jgi:uncharacterized protein (DUF427 family)
MNDKTLAHTASTKRFGGKSRPPGASEPGPGQESVWDYPRPPAVVDDNRLVQVRLGDTLIAETRAAKRVLETASPPTFYLPPQSVNFQHLRPEDGHSRCEWKGLASYYSVCVGNHCARQAAWCYPEPLAAFHGISGYLAFYPSRVACFLDGQRVHAQAGGFYGGWITPEIVGPFKGDPGTGGW